jgi:hypothetical protein
MSQLAPPETKCDSAEAMIVKRDALPLLDSVTHRFDGCHAETPYPRKTSNLMSASEIPDSTRLLKHASMKPGAPHK